jgi:hypothetical protein
MSSRNQRPFAHSACAGHLAYCPDLDPSDFHLFPTLREFLGSRRFKSDDEVDSIKGWRNGLAAEVYDEDIPKPVTGYDKFLMLLATTGGGGGN